MTFCRQYFVPYQTLSINFMSHFKLIRFATLLIWNECVSFCLIDEREFFFCTDALVFPIKRQIYSKQLPRLVNNYRYFMILISPWGCYYERCSPQHSTNPHLQLGYEFFFQLYEKKNRQKKASRWYRWIQVIGPEWLRAPRTSWCFHPSVSLSVVNVLWAVPNMLILAV